MQDLLNYTLPKELIARYPAKFRTSARMLALSTKNNDTKNLHITNIIDYLNPGDCLVVNDTKVIPAQLNGYKETQGKVHCQIDKILDKTKAIVFLKANKAPKINDKIYFSESIYLTIISKIDMSYTVEFNQEIDLVLAEKGNTPIPPYFKRPAEEIDKTRYQTCFAINPGAVAAPTAGLHFDDELLLKIKQKGVHIAKLTLHVGAGTFAPLKPEQLLSGKLHSENIIISQEFCDIYNKAKANNKKIIAVGSTSVRALETALTDNSLKPTNSSTELLIQPGYKFKAIDGILTNFHLPNSSLLLLIAAFYGIDKTLVAYNHAIKNNYKFFSYGDCMLLL